MGQIPTIITSESWYPERPRWARFASLARRRAWYADDSGEDKADADDPQAKAVSSSNDNGEVKIEDLPASVQEYIKSLRQEAASNRVALKKQEDETKAREQKRLQEEGKWRELAESRASQLAEISPYKDRAEGLEGVIREMNKERIGRIPEDRRSLVPENLAPEELSKWLIRNEKLLTAPTAPDIDTGAGGSSGQQIKLTAEERELIAKSGLSEDDFKAARQKLEQISKG